MKIRSEKLKMEQLTCGTFERWLWIELIGFDNEKQDFGVGVFIENVGFNPDVISLLIGDPSFIHDHKGMSKLIKLPPAACSFGAHPFNAERNRQRWTNVQVKDLVCELKRHGIKVFFNVFDNVIFNNVSCSDAKNWWTRYPNVFYVQKTGERINSICPWKRLNGKILYENFFVSKLVQVMRDYGFDGYHMADAYAHPRIPVYKGDWSDDMVGQFLKDTRTILPTTVSGLCDDSRKRIKTRADWIWNNKRKEWIQFHVRRITSFIAKVASALHAENKIVIANSAWTRDPFEAIYRYGTDYGKLAEAGIDAFIVETAAGAMEIDDDELWGPRTSRYLNNFMAALMLNKAYVPHKPMLYLNGIKDYYENWNVLRHSPTTLESEIYSLSNLYWIDDKGASKRCANGPVACLADSIRKDEWQWLNERWNIAYNLNPVRVLGATIVWSDRALENQLDDFIRTRRWTSHRILHHLINVGAPLHCIVNVNNLNNAAGAIVVTNPHLYPADELDAILSYKNGPVILIGGKTALSKRPTFQFSDAHKPDQLFCYCYGRKIKVDETIRTDRKETIPDDFAKLEDPPYFPQELYFREVSDTFLKQCANIIATYADSITIKHGAEFVRTLTLDAGNDRMRIFVRNDKYVYVSPVIDTGRDIAKIEIISPFPHVPITPNGSEFRARVPGHGMIVLDVYS